MQEDDSSSFDDQEESSSNCWARFFCCSDRRSASTVAYDDDSSDDDEYDSTDEDPFTYERVSAVTEDDPIQSGAHKAYYEADTLEDFTFFETRRDDISKLIKFKPKGYKLHIMIDDRHEEEDLARAWEIIKDELINHRIYKSKVIRVAARSKLYDNTDDRGKVVTIYAFKENRSTKGWYDFIKAITVALAAANPPIYPEVMSSTNTAIPGTNYVSYRNDGGRHAVNLFAGIDLTEEAIDQLSPRASGGASLSL